MIQERSSQTAILEKQNPNPSVPKNNEIINSLLQQAFTVASKGKTVNRYTVLKTSHEILKSNCQSQFFTLLKSETGNDLENLGSFCEGCEQKISLPFEITNEMKNRICEQTEFEENIRQKLKQTND